MDLGVLIPIVSIALGIPAGVAFMALAMNHARKTQEMKLREKELDKGGDLGPVVDALSHDLHETRVQVAELQERLDFAERMLTAGRPPETGRAMQ